MSVCAHDACAGAVYSATVGGAAALHVQVSVARRQSRTVSSDLSALRVAILRFLRRGAYVSCLSHCVVFLHPRW